MLPRYRILKYPWHTSHDYELAKLPHDFYYLTNTPRRWATEQRPIPPQIRWVGSPTQIETDLMILHLDQWSFHEPSKRQLFLSQKAAYPGPKIVINHGSNMADGCDSATMQRLVDGCYMVCNSATAQRLWGVPASRTILHGMDPREWPATNYGRPNVLVVQPHSHQHAACRNPDGVIQAEARVKLTWVGRDISFDSFNKYRHYLQSSSIFFQPSYASANPRARAEAMLTGLAIVTTNANGEDEYIENGVNGFCSNDLDELIDALVYLQQHPAEARAIGQRGRETAQRVFHIDRFIAQWNALLQEYVGAPAGVTA
ncbi:MAG: glycosyltransferase [Thermomicrobiales bacterium]